MTPQVRFGDWITKGIELYKQNFGLLVLASLLGLIISITTFGILAGPMAAGLILIALRLLRGQQPKPTVGTLFEGFNYFLQSLLFVLAWGGICILVSLVPCIGPLLSMLVSFALGALLMFGMFLIVDRNMDFWPASKASIEAVKPAFGPLLGFSIIAQLLGHVGALLCGIGIIFTMPIALCSLAVAFDEYMNAPIVEPPPPPIDVTPPPAA